LQKIVVSPDFHTWYIHHDNPQVIMPDFAFITGDPEKHTFITNVDSDYEVEMEYDVRTHI
jgi:hypothetical protein